METRSKKRLGKEPLPGDRQGTFGAGAGRDSRRATGGRVLNGRAPTGLPETNTAEQVTDGKNGYQPEQVTVRTDPLSPTPEIVQSCNTDKQSRQKWTIQQYNDLMWSYYYATETNKVAPKTKGAYAIWRQRNPNIFPDMNPIKLNNQRNMIVKKKWLTDTELNEIKEDVQRHIKQQQVQPNASPTSTQPIQQNTADLTHEEQDIDGSAPTTNHQEMEEEPNPINDDVSKEMEDRIRAKLAEIECIDIKNRKRLKRPRNTKELVKEIETANKVLMKLAMKHPLNISEVNAYMYAAAAAIAGEAEDAEKKPKNDPPWKRRLKCKIEKDRKNLSILKEFQNGVASRHVHQQISTLIRNERIPEYRNFKPDILTQDIKMRLQARAQRLRRYGERCQQFVQNKLFREDTKKFYSHLNKHQEITSEPPSQHSVETFWREILEDDAQHNSKATWIREEEGSFQRVKPQEWSELGTNDVLKAIKKAQNWKAPGPDKLQNFWIKSFSALHKDLARAMNEVMRKPTTIPKWLTSGTTYLIHKGKDPKSPKNYRPITCLPTMYKLLTATVSEKLYDHLMANKILPDEQKGCKKGARGCKDQLLISKMVIQDAKKRKKNLTMAWIDYKKAFDSVPHSWILQALKIYRVSPTIIRFVEESMKEWKTEMYLYHQQGSVQTGQIAIKRGIFQGDSLSPLLFCMSLIPLTNMINRQGLGYEIDGENKVSHLLYMDDLKIFGKSEEQMRQAMHIVKTFSDDIRMEFGLEKCATVVFKGGKRIHGRNLQLNDGVNINNLEQDDVYKYLGVEENDDIQHDQMKIKVRKEYFRRVRLVLKTKLNSKNKISAINSLAVPVPTYSFGIVDWRLDEIKDLDRRTRKMLTMHGIHHPKADADRLYIKRRNGGRGLTELEAAYDIAIVGLSSYIEQGRDKLMKMVKRHEDSKAKYSLTNTAATARMRYVPRTQMTESSHTWGDSAMMNSRVLKNSIEEHRVAHVKNKPLHGQILRQLDKPFVDKEASLAWLRSSDLKGETESLIIAAQDQALNTRYHQRKIIGLEIDSKCRMCSSKEETISHILSGCTTLAATEYTYRHNKIASYIHWLMCKELGTEVQDKWYDHEPQPVINTQDCTIMWDHSIRTDRTIGANRPDIVLHNRAKKTCLLIDVAIPDDQNITLKEAEKISKYKDLQIEVQRMWNTKAKVVPVVIGSLGAIKKGFHKHLEQIPGKPSAYELQKIALQGSAHILRRIVT